MCVRTCIAYFDELPCLLATILPSSFLRTPVPLSTTTGVVMSPMMNVLRGWRGEM